MSVPKCPYFGKCGGCSSQDVNYKEQVEKKKKLLALATRFKDIKTFSAAEYGYRNRMDFVFHKDGLGLRMAGSWSGVVDVAQCSISEPRINNLLEEARQFFRGVDYFDAKSRQGTFRYVVIRVSTLNSSVSLVLNSDSLSLENAMQKVRDFAKVTDADNVIVTRVRADTDVSTSDVFEIIKGCEFLEERYAGRRMLFSAQGFFQNNHVLAEEMHQYVSGLLDKYKTDGSVLLDLYGGVGAFGIFNAVRFEKVVTVENFLGCTLSARRNIELNHCSNVEAVCLDAMKIKTLDLPKDLVVITDPPRAGMHDETILDLNKRKPKLIIYISCNLQQLSKDLAKLRGYKVKSAALFDLFPQTPHAEGIVELVLK